MGILEENWREYHREKTSGPRRHSGQHCRIANNNPAYAPVLGSIRVTMKDPGYIKKLEAANDFALRGPSAAPSGPSLGPAPAAPTPKAPAPAAPAYAPPVMSAPGLGMGSGGRSNAAARHNAIMERLRREQQSPPDNDKKDT